MQGAGAGAEEVQKWWCRGWCRRGAEVLSESEQVQRSESEQVQSTGI